MRILLTVHQWLDHSAGASGATLELASQYRALGHEAQVVGWDHMPFAPPGRIHEFVWYSWLAGHLARRVGSQAIDVVDCVSADASAWGGTVRALSAPSSVLVTRTHGLEHVFYDAKERERSLGHDATTPLIRLREGVDRALVARALRSADLALFLNLADRAYAVERLGLDPNRTRVVPNGVTGELLGRPAPEARPGSPVRIAWLGSYDARKGAAYAVAALTPILLSHPEVTAVFLGCHRPAGEIRSEFPTEVAARIEVVSRFERSQLAGLLSPNDVLLFPSVAEGFSLALVEGMACGLVPVATAVGAATEVIRHGTDGFVVAPRDAEALRAALEVLIQDRVRLDAMRRNAHTRAQQFSWERAAVENLRAYEEATAFRDSRH